MILLESELEPESNGFLESEPESEENNSTPQPWFKVFTTIFIFCQEKIHGDLY